MRFELPSVTQLPTIIVRRNDRRNDRVYTPQQNLLRVPVKVSPELAPKPLDDTAFYGVGRDAAHTWPTRAVYTHLGIEDIQSHMAPWFLFPKVPSAMVVGMPRSGQMPVAGRPNIDSDGRTTYGSLATLRAPQVYSPRYAKLLGG